MKLRLCGGELLDYSALEAMEGDGDVGKTRKQWLHRLHSLHTGAPARHTSEISVWLLLQQAAGEAKLASFVSQVIHRLASRIEVLIARRLQTAQHPRYGKSRVELSWKDSSPADFDWVANLPAYLLAGVAATEFGQEISVSTDKAWVGGMPIQNTSFLTQAGVAIIGIPVVPPDGAIGPGVRALGGGGGIDISRIWGTLRAPTTMWSHLSWLGPYIVWRSCLERVFQTPQPSSSSSVSSIVPPPWCRLYL